MTATNFRSPLIAVVCTFLVPCISDAQDDFVGHKFMPKLGATYHVGNKEVPRANIQLPIVVQKVQENWLLSGQAWIRKSDVITLERSVEYYTDYLRDNGPSAEAMFNRGIVWNERSESVNAIKDFTDAIRLDPGNSRAFYKRGMVRHRRNEIDQSIEDYTEAIRLDAKPAGPFYNRAVAWGAKEDYAEAVRIDPTFQPALKALQSIIADDHENKEVTKRDAIEGQTALLGPPLKDWCSTESISGDAKMSMMPVIAADRKGTLHVAWMQKNSSSFDVFHAMRNGREWSTPVQVYTSPQQSMFPSIALDPAGSAHLVWMEGRAERFDIYYSRWNGSQWSKPRDLSATKGLSQRPKIAVDSTGRAHVLWYGNTDGSFALWHSYGKDDQWTEPVNTGLVKWYITQDPNLTLTPALTLDPHGELHVVWVDIDPVVQQLFHSQWDATNWSSPEKVTTSSNDPGEISLAADASSQLHLAWFDKGDIWYAQSTTKGWSTPLRVNSGSAMPTIHVDTAQVGNLSWTKNGEILYSRNRAGVWEEPISISRNNGQCFAPSITTDISGTVHVVWTDNSGGNCNIFYRCSPATTESN